MKYGEFIHLGDIEIEVVPSYNRDKSFHPYGLCNGYIINFGDTRIYHAGDTDIIPEMKDFKDIDVALLPVSGVYVMNADEAAEACETIKPKLAIPMHYGSIVGSITDAEMFVEQCDVETKIITQKVCKPGECDAHET